MPEIAIQNSPDSALLNAIMNTAVDAIIVSDAEGIILRANDMAARMFGYQGSELISSKVEILMPKSLAHLHDGFMARYQATGQKRILGTGREVEGRHRDGSLFPLHLSVGQADMSGETAYVAILQDLSQRKATEDALARSQRLDAIGQMTGGIAHDFNNLLTVIIGNLELLEMRTPDAKQKPLIRDALDAAELGADLTSRLLVFARRSNLKPQLVDLRTTCDDVFAILSRTLGDAYSIDTDYADHVHQVMLDPVQLQSSLINLVLNARDAMPDGGRLLISVADVLIDDSYMAQETDMEPGAYVRLSISDDGEGMSAEAQKRAFEPFFTTKSQDGGSGLGLAMVYGFVRQSGGHITLYSEPGLGSSFGLYFPVASGKIVADPGSLPPRDSTRDPAREEVVLVVEDNPTVRQLSVQRIRDLGFDTLEANSGDAAYALLCEGHRVDVVFSDLVMPGELNGYDLAARVEREFPSVRVLLTSGYASDVVSGKLPSHRTYEVLHKPYRIADLSAQLHALLSDG